MRALLAALVLTLADSPGAAVLASKLASPIHVFGAVGFNTSCSDL